MVAAVEHLRSLSLGLDDEPNEEGDDQLASSTSGAIFWMAYARDATSAALSGRLPCM